MRFGIQAATCQGKLIPGMGKRQVIAIAAMCAIRFLEGLRRVGTRSRYRVHGKEGSFHGDMAVLAHTQDEAAQSRLTDEAGKAQPGNEEQAEGMGKCGHDTA
jgi:hypothetical protein